MNLSDKLRKLIHPILLKLLPKKDFEVQLINEVPYVKGNKIYVMNHSNKHDGPVSCESIQEHVFLLVGKQALEFLDRIFFFLNGVVYVDRKDKESKRRGSEKDVANFTAWKQFASMPGRYMEYDTEQTYAAPELGSY